MTHKILTINPGATSTKIALFENSELLHKENVSHKTDELSGYKTLLDQLPYRESLIHQTLENADVGVKELSAVVGRGGLLMPIAGGTYVVDEYVIDCLRNAPRGEHASNLGGLLAYHFASLAGCNAYVVDPVATDEFDPIARFSGCIEIERASLFHALNHKAVARRVAAEMMKNYDEVNFIIAHLGTGVSVGAHQKGRVIDVNDVMNEGAFSADRTGGLPSMELVKLCFSGKYTCEAIQKLLVGQSGLAGYIQTKDLHDVEYRIDHGDQYASEVLDAMIYQVAKDIGSMSTVLFGAVDRIILTGGMVFYERLAERIRERVEFIAPVVIVPGEEEMVALAEGALRILEGKETAKKYPWREVEGVWSRVEDSFLRNERTNNIRTVCPPFPFSEN